MTAYHRIYDERHQQANCLNSRHWNQFPVDILQYETIFSFTLFYALTAGVYSVSSFLENEQSSGLVTMQ